jgi:hypothetical protein
MNAAISILITIAYIAIFLFVIDKWSFFKNTKLSSKLLKSVFLLKILTGTALWYIYTYYYPNRNEADIFKFFDDSKILFDSLKSHPAHYFKMLTGIGSSDADVLPYYEKMQWWYSKIYHEQYNESRIMIRFNAFSRLLSLGIYHVHTIFICFISMIGSVSLFKLFRNFGNLQSASSFCIAFLLPSVLFWTSGVLKEGLVLFALGVFLYAFFKIYHFAFNFKSIIIIIFSLLLLIFSKAYLMACLLPCILSLTLTKGKSFKQTIFYYAAINGLYFIILFSLYHISSRFDIVHILCYKRGEYIYLAEHTGVKSLLYNNYLHFHWYSILAESPKAFLTVITRPSIFDSNALLNLMAAAENTFFILMAFLAILSINKNTFKANPLLFFFINFVLITYTLIGLTTPIAGSLIRYKIVAMPFFVAILVMIYEAETLKKRFPIFDKFFQPINKILNNIIK